MSNSSSTATTTSLSRDAYFWLLLHNFEGSQGRGGNRFGGIFGSADTERARMKEYLHWICDDNDVLTEAKKKIDSTVDECYLGKDSNYLIEIAEDNKSHDGQPPLAFEILSDLEVPSHVADVIRADKPPPLYQCRSIKFTRPPGSVYASPEDQKFSIWKYTIPGIQYFQHGDPIVTYVKRETALEWATSAIKKDLVGDSRKEFEPMFVRGEFIGILRDSGYVTRMVVVTQWERHYDDKLGLERWKEMLMEE